MKVLIHPGAEVDVTEAAAFYEAEASPALAFTVIYREAAEGIMVLVVKHDRRRPGYGASRA